MDSLLFRTKKFEYSKYKIDHPKVKGFLRVTNMPNTILTLSKKQLETLPINFNLPIQSRFKEKKPNTGSWYATNKRCQQCQIFITGRDKIMCPCCGYHLRGSPRNKKYKAQLKAHMV